MILFLKEDYNDLVREIKKINDRMKLICEDKGETFSDSGKALNDNFNHDGISSQKKMWSQHLTLVL